MPSIGFGELIIILLIALIVFGPKKLPEMGRTFGRAVREFRRSASELRSDFEADVEDEERPTFPTPPPSQKPVQGDGAKSDTPPT